MDLITHGAVGLALGSLAGGPDIINNPLAIGSFIGSIIPDGDIIYQLKGDYAYLKNHRGPSHSIIMGIIVSLVLAGLLRAFLMIFPFEYFCVDLWELYAAHRIGYIQLLWGKDFVAF